MPVTAPYTPPGVSVNETSSASSVNPLLASPADVCLVGLPGNPSSALSALTATDTLILGLNGSTTPVPLPTLQAINNDAQLVSITSVTNVLQPQTTSPAWGTGQPAGKGYMDGADFTFTANSEAGPDGTGGTITWIATGNIPENTLVQVTYTYVPSDYWNPVRLYDIGSVASRFGPAWATATNASGVTIYTGIHSQITMAAQFAFANGASSVICQPLFTRATPGNPSTAQQPASGADIALTSTWSDTLYTLRPIVNLDIIVPIVGVDGTNVTTDAQVLAIYETIQGHIAYQNSNEIFVMGIFGEDGTANATEFSGLVPNGSTSYVLTEHAAQLQANYGNTLSFQAILLNNTVFNIAVPGSQGGTIAIGGQYAAAAFGGSLAGRPVSSSMTRQYLSGFTSMRDPRTPADKNNDAASGLCVLENYNGGIRCRQGVTLDIQNGPARQEISVVRAKFLLMESIQQVLDNQIIGQIIADANSPLVVASAVGGVLSLLQRNKTIVGYTPPNATLASVSPTVITVKFSYQPAFPLNYIDVSFNLDMSSGQISVTSNVTS